MGERVLTKLDWSAGVGGLSMVFQGLAERLFIEWFGIAFHSDFHELSRSRC